jgi:hypothetical protein
MIICSISKKALNPNEMYFLIIMLPKVLGGENKDTRLLGGKTNIFYQQKSFENAVNGNNQN